MVAYLLNVPDSWPETSFLTNASKPKLILVMAILSASFVLPVLSSCCLYVLVYCSVVMDQNNQIGIVEAELQSSKSNPEEQNQVSIKQWS